MAAGIGAFQDDAFQFDAFQMDPLGNPALKQRDVLFATAADTRPVDLFVNTTLPDLVA